MTVLGSRSANAIPEGIDEALAPTLSSEREIDDLRVRLSAEIAARAELQDSLDLRNAALDAANSHFMIVDARQQHHPIVYANRALAADYGYADPAELIGRSTTILLQGYADDSQNEDARSACEAGRPARGRVEAVRRDGSRFWLGFSMTALRNAVGEVTHYVTLAKDITARLEADRKKQELQEQLYNEMRERERMAIELRLAQKLESVGRLAAGLAHEINTPIQYVGDSAHFLRSAFADLAKLFNAYRTTIIEPANAARSEETLAYLKELETELDFDFLSAEVPKALERTLEGAERVAAIVRAMKEFAHPDANEQSPADLNQAISTTLTVACNEYKYAATAATEFGELPPVICNIGELNQVFLNLIVNAAHAIQDSGKDIRTGRIAIATRAAGDLAEVAITDNGCGIAPENLDKIFDPFFTTKEVGRGTGQGLAIARSIVIDKHGGHIDVQSELGAGTSFLIRLPVNGKGASKGTA